MRPLALRERRSSQQAALSCLFVPSLQRTPAACLTAALRFGPPGAACYGLCSKEESC